MKIVIFTTSYHLGARMAIQKVVEDPKLTVVGIVQTHMASFSLRTIRQMQKFIRRSGYVHFVRTTFLNIWQHISPIVYRFLFPWKERTQLMLEETAAKNNIPFLCTEDINSTEVFGFVQKQKADIGVSVLLMQKLKNPILDFPRRGCINLHPGLFPKYRGIFTNFWPLVHREKWGGVTIHQMTEKIDDGRVLAVKKFRIGRHFSQQCLLEKSAQVGGKLLIKTLRKIQRKEFFTEKIIQIKEKAILLSYPTKKALRKFRSHKKEFFKMKQLFRI